MSGTVVTVNNCPKCGERPYVAIIPSVGSVPYVAVRCTRCVTIGPAHKYNNDTAKDRAVASWNKLSK